MFQFQIPVTEMAFPVLHKSFRLTLRQNSRTMRGISLQIAECSPLKLLLAVQMDRKVVAL